MPLLIALYALASTVLVVYGLQALVLAVRLVRAGGLRMEPDGPGGEGRSPADWPVVTVQLPVYDEPAVVERAIDAACRLDYPAGKLQVQVLDDSPDGSSARALAAARVARWRTRGADAVHLTRPARDGFKAGALAAGLASARGALVAVFDADFVPPPDFLRRTVPPFASDAGLGLVQARWGHLNARASLLTRVQAALLNAHFAVEQEGRDATGLLLSFNGTAGVWRRACIEAAGGWQSDTLTEDLDLSYRAQLAGWRFRFAGRVVVPAELPPTAAAWRTQQFRWTKGTAETAKKLGGRLGRARLPLVARGAGALHLGAFLVHPSLLLLALLHAPLALTGGLGAVGVALAVPGLVAFAGVALAHLAAARALGDGVGGRLALLPALFAVPIGLAVSNTLAVAEALAGRRSPFERTPKGEADAPMGRGGGGVRWAERALALYACTGLAALVAVGAWEAVPFQALAAGGTLVVTASDAAGRLRRAVAVRGPFAGPARNGTLKPAPAARPAS